MSRTKKELNMRLARTAEINRKTHETEIKISFNVDGTGTSRIDTGIPFMNHMLELFSKHGFFDLEINAHGDLEVDAHHTMEDLGLVLGEAIAQAVGDKIGIRRYGSCLLPMDETLAEVALDISGRPYLVYLLLPPNSHVNNLDCRLFYEFFQALTVKAGLNLHIQLRSGEEVHHVFEAVFKTFAKALDQALTIDPRIKGVLSTKGII